MLILLLTSLLLRGHSGVGFALATVSQDVHVLKVFMLSADAILNIETLSELLASGHSRVPVHVPGNR